MTKTTKIILGIDEVGRGPWAGPLVVGAVILGDGLAQVASPSKGTTDTDERFFLWQNLTDSKKLSVKKREKLNSLIQKHAAAYATGWVSAAEIDQHGLSASLKLATRRAVKQVLAQKVYFDEIIIDGTINFLKNTPLEDRVTMLAKADFLIKEVSAASIIAKVARDNYMIELGQKYPGYGFEKHVGYGTAMHQAALQQFGPCPEHRKSFKPIAKYLTPTKNTVLTEVKNRSKNYTPGANKHTPNTTTRGQHAETAARKFLEAQNHTIVAQNYKTKTYEIDLISIKNNQIFFTEVKYSQKTAVEGTPFTRITAAKQKQMAFAAECFMKANPKYQNLQPLLAAAEVIGTDYTVKNWFTLD